MQDAAIFCAALVYLALLGMAVVPQSGTATNGQVEVRPLVPAPSERSQWDAWRQALAQVRRQTRREIGYSDALYRRDDFAWIASCYSCCFAMMYDQTFCDPVRGRYTVGEYLAAVARDFGGYDAVVLWHAYPRIGFDDRNQFDFYRDMPGGLNGLRELSHEIHHRGVKVFINYNPWDTGTRREGRSDLEMLVEFVAAIEADGIFLDTLHEGMSQLRDRLDAVRPGVVLESELTLPVERIHDHHMSWAQWFRDSEVPGVLWNKWFERRHMMHQIHRWSRDHTAELQMAWMNGSGMLVWENVFGTWMGWSPRDRSILRSMLPIQRRYVELFSGEGWVPLVGTERTDVYASLWHGGSIRLWTLVNRAREVVDGVLLEVPDIGGDHYYDLIRGREVGRRRDSVVLLEGRLRPHDIGAFVAGDAAALGSDFPQFLAARAKIDAEADWSIEVPTLQENSRRVHPTRKYKEDEISTDMAIVRGATVLMKTTYRNRECGLYRLPGQSLPAHPSAALHRTVGFEREVVLRPFAIDKTPVTNAQYARFLRETGYEPAHTENFLKHWDDRRIPPGLEDHPVVHVDLQDARAYAQWAGKRLPTEQEWQYAAQGVQGWNYPWGDQWERGRCNDGQNAGTTAVTAFPEGRSPFGCYDMCGNTWEWTESERSDGRTRFCIIKGGAFYRAEGSDWYADGGPQPSHFAAKFLLLWPGLDRCATIGFRCVVDLADGPENGP